MCLVLRRRLFARTPLDRLANLFQNASDDLTIEADPDHCAGLVLVRHGTG